MTPTSQSSFVFRARFRCQFIVFPTNPVIRELQGRAIFDSVYTKNFRIVFRILAFVMNVIYYYKFLGFDINVTIDNLKVRILSFSMVLNISITITSAKL